MNYEPILNALKGGTVPPYGVEKICFGRDKEIEEFDRLLDSIEEDEKSIIKFINGNFGVGKSLFLNVIEEKAFFKNFLVSRITLGNDIPFNKIDVVYTNIAKNLVSKSNKNKNDSFKHIIEKWINGISRDAREEYDDFKKQKDYIKSTIYDELEYVREYSNDFAVAIEKYNDCLNKEDYETANYILSWLCGEEIHYTIRRKIGVQKLTKENAFDLLRALTVFVKSIGYSGTVILFDESESIMKSIAKTNLRNIAYDYIRKIYDDCNEYNYENTFFIFAGTPQFFEDLKRGVASYPALDERLKKVIPSDLPDMRQPVVVLNGLSSDVLYEISESILKMHKETYSWNPDDIININSIVQYFVDDAELVGGEVNPRYFSKGFIQLLDIVQQNPNKFKSDKDVLDLFKEQIDGMDML